MTATTSVISPSTVAAASPRAVRLVGTGTALRVELRKLLAQKRVRYVLLGCLVAPVIATLVLHGQQRPPKDTLYGRHIKDSGYAVALFTLTFATQWVLVFLTAIVAGDIFASEDHLGTWKTVLTRSASRGKIFVAKCMAAGLFAVAVLVVLAISTIGSGLTVVGHQDLVGLTGQLIPSSSALGLVAAAWATALPPLLAFTAIAVLFSVLTRNPAIGVVAPIVLGLASQLLGWLGGIDGPRRLLPSNPFDAWHGLLTEHRYYNLVGQGLLVSSVWVALCCGAAYFVFARRDITGG